MEEELVNACKEQNLERMEELLKDGANIYTPIETSSTVLLYICEHFMRYNILDGIKLILNINPDPNYINIIDDDCCTVICYLVMNIINCLYMKIISEEDISALEYLLEHGANPNIYSKA